MTIERKLHFDPEESWESLKTWIAGAAKDPSGEPVTEPIAKIMAVGAYIGLRFGLVSEAFALAVAEYGNSLPGTHALPSESNRGSVWGRTHESPPDEGRSDSPDIPPKTAKGAHRALRGAGIEVRGGPEGCTEGATEESGIFGEVLR